MCRDVYEKWQQPDVNVNLMAKIVEAEVNKNREINKNEIKWLKFTAQANVEKWRRKNEEEKNLKERVGRDISLERKDTRLNPRAKSNTKCIKDRIMKIREKIDRLKKGERKNG